LYWNDIYKLFAERNIPIYMEPKPCDISVVLGGTLVNPIPLRGKKVLAFKKDEWKAIQWDHIFKPILEEYYDHIIDTTGLSPDDTFELIEKECKSLELV